MAGYIGTKAVNLSTTGADIAGDADVSGALDVGGAFTSQGIDDNATSTAMTLDASGNVDLYQGKNLTWRYAAGSTIRGSISIDSADNVTFSNGSSNTERMRIDNSGNVGIGTSSPNDKLTISGSAAYMTIDRSDGEAGVTFRYNGDNTKRADIATQTNGDLRFRTNLAEAMRIDSSGNLLVGNTSFAHGSAGALLASNGRVYSTVDGNFTFTANRLSSDGEIIRIQKDTATVGSIGVHAGNNIVIGSAQSGHAGIQFGTNVVTPYSVVTYSDADNTYDFGSPNYRWNDAYITNGVTTGSDGNDKQDIRDLTEAEQRVAVACKGLLKAWRWKSAVEEKGDNARIHCGIIAQDLQAAFAAEGLDAGDYAMFMSNTWWEHDVEVPAVESVAEVLDEDGNVVTEAVEAVDAYTRTDTYDTQEEAPEGATERTRLGVRYSELLAFIIGAL
jgi:hypothetical protein